MLKGMESYAATLDPEMRAMVDKCETREELFALAKREGWELPDEALDWVYGGCGGSSYTTVVDYYWRCKIHKTAVMLKTVGHDGWPNVYYCNQCLTTKDEDELEWYRDEQKVKK